MRRFCYLLILTIGCQSLADLGSLEQLQKKTARMLSGASGAGRDLEATDYLMGKFMFSLDGKPAWYPEFYPNENEMVPGNDFKPRISLLKRNIGTDVLLAPVLELFQEKNPAGVCEPISPILDFNPNLGEPFCLENAKRYTVDSTRLASLEETPLSGQYQSALVSVFNMDALGNSQKTQLIANPSVSIKKIVDSESTVSSKQALFDPRRVSFIRYNARPDNPLALESITSQVGGIVVNIPVALPPAPSCSLELLTSQALKIGDKARFALKVDSLTYSASISDGMNNLDLDATKLNLSAGSIGVPTVFKEFELTVPVLENPQRISDSLVGWEIYAEVRGVDSLGEPSHCTLEVPIQTSPSPNCLLKATNLFINAGESTTLTLDCRLRGGGPITSAQVNGVELTSEQLTDLVTTKLVKGIPFTRPSGTSIDVASIVVGPGGTDTDNVIFGPFCKYMDPYEVYTSQYLRKFRRLDWDGGGGYLIREHSGSVVFGTGPGAIRMNCKSDHICMSNRIWPAQTPNAHVVEIGPKTDPNCKVTQYKMRTGGCFTSDTQIQMANGSMKLASEIQENDYVFNPHYSTGVRVQKVVKGPEKKALYLVYLGSKKVEVTEDHPFLTSRGWMQAMALKKGDKLLGNGKPVFVSQVKKLRYKGPQDVWNFELDTDDPMAHVVIANGIPTGDLVTQLELKKPKAKLP